MWISGKNFHLQNPNNWDIQCLLSVWVSPLWKTVGSAMITKIMFFLQPQDWSWDCWVVTYKTWMSTIRILNLTYKMSSVSPPLGFQTPEGGLFLQWNSMNKMGVTFKIRFLNAFFHIDFFQNIHPRKLYVVICPMEWIMWQGTKGGWQPARNWSPTLTTCEELNLTTN